jgi:hypothetical protein
MNSLSCGEIVLIIFFSNSNNILITSFNYFYLTSLPG